MDIHTLAKKCFCSPATIIRLCKKNGFSGFKELKQARKIQSTKRKVAAYCRVSTDNEDQTNSFESQQRYFRQYIERNSDWELYEVFAEMKIA